MMSEKKGRIVRRDMTVRPGEPCPHPFRTQVGAGPMVCDVCGSVAVEADVGYHWPPGIVPAT
jgi:hypothetical protein